MWVISLISYLMYWKGISLLSPNLKASLKILEISFATVLLSQVVFRLTLPITYLCQLSPSPSLWNGKYITFLIWNAFIFGDNFRFPFYFSCWRILHSLRCLEIPSRIFHLPFTTWPWGVIKGRIGAECWLVIVQQKVISLHPKSNYILSISQRTIITISQLKSNIQGYENTSTPTKSHENIS